jgi:hypothetical protein
MSSHGSPHSIKEWICKKPGQDNYVWEKTGSKKIEVYRTKTTNFDYEWAVEVQSISEWEMAKGDITSGMNWYSAETKTAALRAVVALIFAEEGLSYNDTIDG